MIIDSSGLEYCIWHSLFCLDVWLCINLLWIIKFLAAILAFILRYLSFSHGNMNAFTVWTRFIKISCHLKKFIIGWFNKSFFLSFQKLITKLTKVITCYKVRSMGVISNWKSKYQGNSSEMSKSNKEYLMITYVVFQGFMCLTNHQQKN